MQDKIFEDIILIPKERISIVIGLDGSTKKTLEKKGNIKLDIDSIDGVVKINANDALDLWIGSQVINAIGRGFSAEVAQKLFKEGQAFELIPFTEFAGKSKKTLHRLKGRVIGEQGKSKRILQKYTNTDIIIYGKTVGIIGRSEDVELARKAVEMLLTGAKHGTVFRFVREETDSKNVRKHKRTNRKTPSKREA